MLITLCSLLAAASPVSTSLLPQPSAVHLLDHGAVDFLEDRTAGPSASAAAAGRLGVEAISGVLGAALVGGASALVTYIVVPPGAGYIVGWNEVMAVLVGLVGLEVGEVLGITVAGSAFGVSINPWHVVLGNLVAIGGIIAIAIIAAMMPPLAVSFETAAAFPAVLGVLGTLAGGVLMPEILGGPEMQSGLPLVGGRVPGLTLRF